MARDLGPAAPADVGLSAEALDRIDARLQGFIDDKQIAGVVTLVARHGKVVHTSELGAKNMATGEPLAHDTIFRIFSMTKPVTGVAMMILHDQGLWSPDDLVEKHLPQFKGVKLFTGLDGEGKPVLGAPKSPPTMRQLMTHTAGLSYGFNPADPVDQFYVGAQVWGSENLEQLTGRVAAAPLNYEPGTKWQYGIAMELQGAIIEKLSGQSLPAFMQDHIFGPLGMVDTAFHTPPEKASRLATLYRMSKKSGLTQVANPLMRDHDAPPSLAIGGGGLVSTVSDYARFAQMLLNGGELNGVRIVSAEGLKLQMSNHLSDEMLAAGHGVGQQQLRPGFGYGFNGAVFTDPAAAGVPVGLGTYHWDGAAGTWFWVDPVHDLLYVGLIQLLSETAPPLQKITQTMMADAILT